MNTHALFITKKNLYDYLFFQIEYSTHTATKPTTPSAPRPFTIAVTEPTTSTVGTNGIAAPLNNTCNTSNNAKTDTLVSARAPAHFLIVAKISIIWILLYNQRCVATVGKIFKDILQVKH